MNMQVVKRDGRREDVSFDKILRRLKFLAEGLDETHMSYELIAQKTIEGVHDGVSTVELDNLAAEIAATKAVDHPDYAKLAAKIVIANIQKEVEPLFSKNIELLYNYKHPEKGTPSPLVSDQLYKMVTENTEEIDKIIQPERDFNYDYFGIKTLQKTYLLRRNKQVAETPQQLLLRVSIGIHGDDMPAVKESYNLLSQKYFTHATPTTITSGTPWPRLSSCFLVAMKDDSIMGIYDTLKETALISQGGAGIGVHLHNVRARGSYIKGTGGYSNGLVPMLRVYNETARYVDQGGGKRKGAFAMYLEPWHADIFDFLELKKNHGKEEMRARDLFYAMWIPDLFMERVREEGVWSLMDPAVSTGLADVYGDEFKELYEKYEKEGKYMKQIPAQDLWFKIVQSQIETGTPYMLYKDSVNNKSGQKNLGVIKSSNLCAEITEYSDENETAVCNLASVALPKFLDEETGVFDFQQLREVVHVIVNNLDRVIDVNKYPVPETETSNFKHRPMGIGVQGMANIFAMLKLPFGSERSKKLNIEIFETIYFSALEKSNQLAEERGKYASFEGSPASQGILQFDMWAKSGKDVHFSGRWDWDKLKEKIKKTGLRNSLFVAQMPTGSTSQLLGNNEATEAFTSNMYLRRTLSGEFIVINKHLLKDLVNLGLWNKEMKNKMMLHSGSIQDIDEIPDNLKEIYKTVWEIPQKIILDMAADRGPFVDQAQSMNIHITDPTVAKITSMHFYGWKAGLKTGMYYLRTQAARDAIKFTVDKVQETKQATTIDGLEIDKTQQKLNVAKVSKDKKVKENIVIIDDNDPNICIDCGA